MDRNWGHWSATNLDAVPIRYIPDKHGAGEAAAAAANLRLLEPRNQKVHSSSVLDKNTARGKGPRRREKGKGKREKGKGGFCVYREQGCWETGSTGNAGLLNPIHGLRVSFMILIPAPCAHAHVLQHTKVDTLYEEPTRHVWNEV